MIASSLQTASFLNMFTLLIWKFNKCAFIWLSLGVCLCQFCRKEKGSIYHGIPEFTSPKKKKGKRHAFFLKKKLVEII